MTNLNDYVTEGEASKLLGLQTGKGEAWRHLRNHAPHIELVELFGFTAVCREDLENYIQDARKEVGNVGELHPAAKLTKRKVRFIRARYAKGGISQRRLAQRYGVSASCIGDVIKEVTWNHVEGDCGWATGDKKRLTIAEVMAIRSEYFTTGTTQNTLAKKYGVSQSAISMIVNRKTWRFE